MEGLIYPLAPRVKDAFYMLDKLFDQFVLFVTDSDHHVQLVNDISNFPLEFGLIVDTEKLKLNIGCVCVFRSGQVRLKRSLCPVPHVFESNCLQIRLRSPRQCKFLCIKELELTNLSMASPSISMTCA